MPTVIESSFSADVVRREKQRILVLVEKFASFAVAQIIPDEKHDTLQQHLLQLCSPLEYVDGCTIRVDNAPDFVSLREDKLLLSLGIHLEFSRIKSKNENLTVDKMIQELEGEIKRLSADGGFLSLGTLSIAASNVNSRIRNTGLSAKEIIMKRDAITNEPIHIDDNKLQDFKYEKRIQNHGYSEKSK